MINPKLTLSIFFLCIAELLAAQTISNLSPNSGNAGQSLTISITGSNTHFTAGSAALADFEFAQGSSTTTNINVLSWTNIEADVDIPAAATTGYYDLYAYNSFDGDLHTDRAFYVNGTPQRFTISPTGANPGQTLTITITGSNTHFNSASPTAYIDLDFVQGSATSIVQGNLSIANDTLMAAQFTIPPVVTSAYYSVYVSTDQDGRLVAPNALSIPAVNGINEINNNEISLSAYPNPYVDRVMLNGELKKSSTVEIEIFTSGGKKIFEKSLEKIPAGRFNLELKTKALEMADDIYFVKCKTANSASVVKLIHLK